MSSPADKIPADCRSTPIRQKWQKTACYDKIDITKWQNDHTIPERKSNPQHKKLPYSVR
jgi:hypothetical protein